MKRKEKAQYLQTSYRHSSLQCHYALEKNGYMQRPCGTSSSTSVPRNEPRRPERALRSTPETTAANLQPACLGRDAANLIRATDPTPCPQETRDLPAAALEMFLLHTLADHPEDQAGRAHLPSHRETGKSEPECGSDATRTRRSPLQVARGWKDPTGAPVWKDQFRPLRGSHPLPGRGCREPASVADQASKPVSDHAGPAPKCPSWSGRPKSATAQPQGTHLPFPGFVLLPVLEESFSTEGPQPPTTSACPTPQTTDPL